MIRRYAATLLEIEITAYTDYFNLYLNGIKLLSSFAE